MPLWPSRSWAVRHDGRPMKGWIVVEGDALAEDEQLAHWIERGLEYAGWLPPK